MSALEIALARKELYSWLSAALYKPEEDILQKDFPRFLGEINKILNYGLEEEISTLESSIGAGTISLQSLLIEYSRLFVGPSSLLAPPYGSYYLDGGRVMGESTLDVINFYRSSKMQLSPEFKDLPDHIAVEINFLSFLCEFEIKAHEENKAKTAAAIREKELNFLTAHPLKWVSLFTAKIEKEAQLPFYKVTAAVLKKALQKEQEHLRRILLRQD